MSNSISKINSNFGFTPLKEVWLGDCYPESFYDHLPNEIADPFRQITQWTKEDTGHLQTFLEERGIIVRRPVFSQIDDYIDTQNNLIKPPICPRDHYLVLGDTLYGLHNHLKSTDPWQYWFDYYQSHGLNVQQPTEQPINCLNPPCIVRVGRDLYIDQIGHCNVWGFVSEWLIEQSKHYRINISNTDGHSDGVFCPVAKNIIVTSKYKQDYTESFPNWNLFRIPEQLSNFTSRKYWTTGDKNIDNNKCFNDHILLNASNWVGNFQETVPEVNMLVIDEHNVVAMKDYPPLTEWLDKQGITVHYFDFRTRSFWDGGWHCLTLDIHRNDTKDDLFPERGVNGVYWRLN